MDEVGKKIGKSKSNEIKYKKKLFENWWSRKKIFMME